MTITTTNDAYGWHQALDGTHFITLFVETGRVKDVDGHRMKTALRRVAEKFSGIEFRLTGNQNVILANVVAADKAATAGTGVSLPMVYLSGQSLA